MCSDNAFYRIADVGVSAQFIIVFVEDKKAKHTRLCTHTLSASNRKFSHLAANYLMHVTYRMILVHLFRTYLTIDTPTMYSNSTEQKTMRHKVCLGRGVCVYALHTVRVEQQSMSLGMSCV